MFYSTVPHLCCFLTLTIIVRFTSANVEDYFSVDFDRLRNCTSGPDELKELYLKEQCETVVVTNDTDLSGICKRKLAKNIYKRCMSAKGIKSVGNSTFCNTRGVLTCCYDKYTCMPWTLKQSTSFQSKEKVASIFMKTKSKTNLENPLVSAYKNYSGYASCHPIDSYNVLKCALDCEEFAKNEFSKNCTSNGGVFKCCIRRGHFHCHECRYCCTLPMCSYPKDSLDGLPKTVFNIAPNEWNKERADHIFNQPTDLTPGHEDNRCVKPFSQSDSQRWETYDMEAFKRADTIETLEKVPLVPFNKFINNFYDPEVFGLFAKKKKAVKSWRKAYGVYYASHISGHKVKGRNTTFVNYTRCALKCARLEKSKFAKKCRLMKVNCILSLREHCEIAYQCYQ